MLKQRPAFTRIELLVLITVIFILTGLLVPGAEKARAAAARITCGNGLKQIDFALRNCHDAEGCLPPSGGGPPFGRPPDVL